VNHLLLAAIAAAVLTGAVPSARAAGTLDSVRAAGALACGVVTEETDYSKDDTHGGLDDLGGELCKAVATAVLGANARAKVVGHPDERAALLELAAGHTDLLIGVTPTATKAATYGVMFGPPVFFDGQGVMVSRTSGIRSLADLAGKQVCYIDNTENEWQLAPGLEARGIALRRFPFQEMGEMDAALVTGHCAAETADVSQLAEQRAAFHDRRKDFVILPETITFDPLAPAVRQDDPRWADVVTWALAALVQAEASGVTRANVAAMLGSDDPTVRRLLGRDRAAARALGLADDWAATMIAAFGNYGEIYDRTVGPGTELNLPRGRNALWRDGGLLFPLPVR
jgi:general L-amino acid transport system substrate-binding protein